MTDEHSNIITSIVAILSGFVSSGAFFKMLKGSLENEISEKHKELITPIWAKIDDFKKVYVSKDYCNLSHEQSNSNYKNVKEELKELREQQNDHYRRLDNKIDDLPRTIMELLNQGKH